MTTKIYALDFDGVICDSVIETALTGWKVAKQFWLDMPEEPMPELIDYFRLVRPIMETGFEAILIMRAVFEGQQPDLLFNQFEYQLSHIIRRDLLNEDKLKKRFGELRDDWINNDLDGWIAMNPLFEGIKQKLQNIDVDNAYIITTKQERFVSRIFENNDINFPEEHVFGLDRQLSKEQVLRQLITQYPKHNILFVEDRLPTLLRITEDESLVPIQLFFANWGYSTAEDKAIVDNNPKIVKLELKGLETL